MIENKTKINFQKGKLNIIIDPKSTVEIDVGSIEDFNSNCKGNGRLKFIKDEGSYTALNFLNPLEINGTTYFDFFFNQINAIKIDSITIKNDAIFGSSILRNFAEILNVKVELNSNIEIKEGIIKSTLSIDQTGFITFNNDITTRDLKVYLKIHNFSRIVPFFGGYLSSLDGNIILNKVNSD